METRLLSAAAPGALDEAVAALARGELVAFPTDTVYGLACGVRDPELLHVAKERPKEKRIPVLLADSSELDARATVTSAARALITRYWPGALTVVLVSAGDTVAFRVPANDVARRLIAAFGGALPVTSANRSGGPDARTAREVLDQLGGRIHLVLDGGRTAGTASTVVDCSVEPPRVLREGAVSAAAIDALVGAPALR